MARARRRLEDHRRIWQRSLGPGPSGPLQKRIEAAKSGRLSHPTETILRTLARSFDLRAARHNRKLRMFPTDNGSRMARIAWLIASAELKRTAHSLQED